MSLLDRPTTDDPTPGAIEDGDAYETDLGRWSRRVAAGFVEWLAIPPGGVWLDVGSGTGALTGAICDLATPLAVTGADASPGFVTYASEHSTAPTADFVVADAAALPFTDGLFDVVVSGLVLDVLADPVAALREQARVADTNGIVAAYVWDYAAGMRLVRQFWDAARRVAPSAVALDQAVRFPAGSPRGLERLFETAGLDPLGTTAIEIETAFTDFDELWRPFERGQGPAARFLASLDDAERASVRVGLQSALPVASDGSITLAARAWGIRARP